MKKNSTWETSNTTQLNADSEYAKSFGIDKGDILYLEGFRNAVEGDLILVEINGQHQLDTYNEASTVLDENSIGVLVGCYKGFKEQPEIVSEDDDILSASFLELAEDA